jgi:hypothetical protein
MLFGIRLRSWATGLLMSLTASHLESRTFIDAARINFGPRQHTAFGKSAEAGGQLEIGPSTSSSILVAVNSGTLTLDQSQSFNGQIAGFANQDEVDLRDVDFAHDVRPCDQ